MGPAAEIAGLSEFGPVRHRFAVDVRTDYQWQTTLLHVASAFHHQGRWRDAWWAVCGAQDRGTVQSENLRRGSEGSVHCLTCRDGTWPATPAAETASRVHLLQSAGLSDRAFPPPLRAHRWR